MTSRRDGVKREILLMRLKLSNYIVLNIRFLVFCLSKIYVAAQIPQRGSKFLIFICIFWWLIIFSFFNSRKLLVELWRVSAKTIRAVLIMCRSRKNRDWYSPTYRDVPYKQYSRLLTPSNCDKRPRIRKYFLFRKQSDRPRKWLSPLRANFACRQQLLVTFSWTLAADHQINGKRKHMMMTR